MNHFVRGALIEDPIVLFCRLDRIAPLAPSRKTLGGRRYSDMMTQLFETYHARIARG